MSSEQDKDLVRRLFEAFDAVDNAAMDELLSPDFVAHGLAPLFSEDGAGWKQLAAHWANGFSDEQLALDQACRRVVSTGLKGKGLTLPGFATPTQPSGKGLCGEEDIA